MLVYQSKKKKLIENGTFSIQLTLVYLIYRKDDLDLKNLSFLFIILYTNENF